MHANTQCFVYLQMLMNVHHLLLPACMFAPTLLGHTPVTAKRDSDCEKTPPVSLQVMRQTVSCLSYNKDF